MFWKTIGEKLISSHENAISSWENESQFLYLIQESSVEDIFSTHHYSQGSYIQSFNKYAFNICQVLNKEVSVNKELLLLLNM